MNTVSFRTFVACIAVLLFQGCAAESRVYVPPVERPSLVQIEVYDRSEHTTLPVYTKDGRRYIVGTPGNEYSLRIRNRTGARVLVVTSVDGVNVISGDTASPSQSGYVLDPYGSVDVIGWRKSLQRTAAFFFTDLHNSYAARTGRPENVGVIGVAVFREKPQPIAVPRRERAEPYASEAAPAAPSSTIGPRGLSSNELESDSVARQASKLGTGHGRSEASPVRVVTFDRASDTPSETIAIQYDQRENLAALGVLPPTPRITRREPDPFPGQLRFAPDPR